MAASIALPMVSDQRSGNQLDVLAHAVCAFLVQTIRAAPTVEETWRFLLLTLMKTTISSECLRTCTVWHVVGSGGQARVP